MKKDITSSYIDIDAEADVAAEVAHVAMKAYAEAKAALSEAIKADMSVEEVAAKMSNVYNEAYARMISAMAEAEMYKKYAKERAEAAENERN